MGANLQSDFLSRPVQPGEPMPSETTIQGWLAARSRVQLYHNHVRWAWQTAGIWDAFIAGKHDEARAECGLAGTAPALNQTFAQHQAPSALELQHSVLYDHRWADAEKMQHRVVNKHLQNLQVFAQKNMFMISKKTINKNWQNMWQEMQYRHPPIQEHLVYSRLICMYMYIYVIFTAHICVYNAVFGGYRPV